MINTVIEALDTQGRIIGQITLPLTEQFVTVRARVNNTTNNDTIQEKRITLTLPPPARLVGADANQQSHTHITDGIVCHLNGSRTNGQLSRAWHADFGSDFDIQFECYTLPLWNVLTTNLAVFSFTYSDLTRAIRRKPQYAKFVQTWWGYLKRAFIEDPYLFLSNLSPEVFASFMYFMSDVMIDGGSTEFRDLVPVYLAIHKRQVPREIFMFVVRDNCPCMTCKNIKDLRPAGIMSEEQIREQFDEDGSDHSDDNILQRDLPLAINGDSAHTDSKHVEQPQTNRRRPNPAWGVDDDPFGVISYIGPRAPWPEGPRLPIIGDELGPMGQPLSVYPQPITHPTTRPPIWRSTNNAGQDRMPRRATSMVQDERQDAQQDMSQPNPFEQDQ